MIKHKTKTVSAAVPRKRQISNKYTNLKLVQEYLQGEK